MSGLDDLAGVKVLTRLFFQNETKQHWLRPLSTLLKIDDFCNVGIILVTQQNDPAGSRSQVGYLTQKINLGPGLPGQKWPKF